jgi:hypothetical protein
MSKHNELRDKIKIGDSVTWLCKPNGDFKFKAEGIVVEIYKTTVGSSVVKDVAKIKAMGKYLEVYLYRKNTTVSIDKLSKSNSRSNT